MKNYLEKLNRGPWDSGGSGGGSGDVVGPGSSTDNAAARFDLATGKLLQDGPVIITDAGAVSGITSLAMGGNLTGATNVTTFFETPMPQSLAYEIAGGVTELTNGTPTYAYIVLAQQKKFTSITFLCTSFTSTAVYELCFYGWAASGNVSKYGAGILANGNCTATGKFTLTFATPVTLPAGYYDLGILKVSGSANIVIRTGISNSTYMFLGAAAAAVLPATETTRNSQSGAPYMEFL